MQNIPLIATPSQTLTASLGGQTCQINVYQKNIYTDNNETATLTAITPMFLDLYVSNALVIGGVICLNNIKIVRDSYLGFIGDLVFTDTAGTADPVYSGLGARYQLVYLEALDL